MNLLITYLKWCVFHKCARLFQSRPGARCLLSHLLSDLQANQCDVAKSLPGSKSICERGHPCSLWSGQNLLEWCTAFVCKIFPQGYCVLSVPDFWPPFDHCCANALWNAGKACCDNQQWAFSRFGLNCAEPINFTFQRRSIPPCRSSPTTATGQVFGLLLCDTALFASAKTQWSTVVRPRIDHYWKLTTLQDWNTL